MNITNQLTTIFCQVDDFCKTFDEQIEVNSLPSPTKTNRRRGRQAGLATSEIMTLLIMFHHIRFRDFKTFYLFVEQFWRSAFPGLPSYTRFVSILDRATLPLTMFIHCRSGKRTGIYYIDSSGLPVCHLKRSKRHKTFDQLAAYGRSSVGWFFGLKIHLVINDKGQLMAFKLTRGNHADTKAALPLLNSLDGLAFGDKGYLGKSLAETLMTSGLKLITRKRKNMKQPVLSDLEKQLLNQRGIVETVIGYLKHHYLLWHTRHRSVTNAITHFVSALAAYVIDPVSLSAMKLLDEAM